MRGILHWTMAVAAAAIYAFTLTMEAQTSPRADQIRGLASTSPEAAWCPGEPLRLVDSQILDIGPSWTAETPCYAHFNLTPPTTVDPISVSRFTAPARVTLTPGVWSDDLYIYLQAPAFSGAAMTRPQRIIVQTSSPANVSCSMCIVESAGTGLRMFPAFSMPVGLARVEAGALHPALDPIINSHQLYIGADLGVQVRRDGAGVWIELSRTAALAQQQIMAAQLAAGSLEVARVRQAITAPLPDKRLASLEMRIESLQEEYLQFEERMPMSRDDVEKTREVIRNAESVALQVIENTNNQISMLQDNAELRLREVTASIAETVVGVDRTAKPGTFCTQLFGIDGSSPLVCDSGRWKKFKTK